MGQIVKIVQLTLFFVSSIGYWEIIRKKSRINQFFIPGFTIASQILILFVAGLLNCLRPTYLMLFVVGLMLATYFLVKEKIEFIRIYINDGFVFLFCSIFLCIIALKGRLFVHYDNFSHWALVVRNMLETCRFPNFQDTLIGFQSYPLGSSVYIFYFAKIVSEKEWIQMLAQSYMMLCFILPIFSCKTKHRVLNVVILAIFTNFVLCYNITINQLLVDTLLPLEGMTTVFFILSECIKRNEGEQISFLYAIPFLCATIQTKNSGIFFVVLACIIIITAVLQYKLDWKSGVATCLYPFISLYLWQVHCSYVFPAALTSMHAMSISNYIKMFSRKTTEDISIIAEKIISLIFYGKDLLFFLAFLIVVTAITIAFMRWKWKKLIEVWAACFSIYIIYMLGMFCMYAFSMPEGEATSLAGFDRYRRTILIALYYIIIWFFIQNLSQIESIRNVGIAVVAVMLMLLVTRTREQFITIFSSVGDVSERLWFEEVVSGYRIQSKKTYIICTPSDTGYARYLCKYILYSNDISSRIITEEKQLDDAEKYDDVIIYDDKNGIIKEWVSKNYPEQLGQDVIMVGE